MKNPKLIAGVVVVVLLLIVGGWFISRPRTSVTVATPDGQGTMQVQTQDAKMSISDIMGRGGNVKCTYQAEAADSGSQTTVLYISGSKMRVESQVKDDEGKNRQSTTISDGQYIYVWSDEEDSGVKIPAPKDTEQPSDAWQGQAQYIDPNQKVDYKCDSWNVDQAMFFPPSDITFTDFGAMQQSQCAMCESLTGEQKQTCLTSLNCD